MDKVLVIDDEADVQYSFRRTFSDAPLEISCASSGEEGLLAIPKIKPDLIIMDVRMGGMNGFETLRRIRKLDARLPVIMMTAYGTTQTAIEAMKLGAYDYLLKPFDVPELQEIVSRALKASHAMKQVVTFEPLLESEDYDQGIVGRSLSMRNIFKVVGQLASTDATALITGESGTGKELVARAIYQNSARSKQPFLAINCAAIPEQLLESELFGHEKGSFTGASSQRIGKFEQCHMGTIFLDEIGDMSLATQTKILRVLQSGTFERVGGNERIDADVRIIAATNRNLEEAVELKQFREDLFYRLKVVRIEMPPLRERADDIPLLVNFFLKKFCNHPSQQPKSIAKDAVEALTRYEWPGNVRELENVIRRALVMTKGDAVLFEDLPREIRDQGANTTKGANREIQPHSPPPSNASVAIPAAATDSPVAPASPQGNNLQTIAKTLFDWAKTDRNLKVLPAVERELVVYALEETKGNQVQAAKLLGITRATLRKRIEKFSIRQRLSVD